MSVRLLAKVLGTYEAIHLSQTPDHLGMLTMLILSDTLQKNDHKAHQSCRIHVFQGPSFLPRPKNPMYLAPSCLYALRAKCGFMHSEFAAWSSLSFPGKQE